MPKMVSAVKRTATYDGKPQGYRKKKARRKSSTLVDLGLAETTLGGVNPATDFHGASSTASITAADVLDPNYTLRQKDLEGTRAAPGHNLNPTAWLKHTDGKYGLLSLRLNLGSENLTETGGSVFAETGMSALNMHKSKVKGDSTFVKNLHLKCSLKYVTPDPKTAEIGGYNQAITYPPSVRVRMLVVRQKRGKLGLPMYSLDPDRNHHDNAVGSNLFLDPIGRPFGINDQNFSTGTNLSTNYKKQTPEMHFKSPVQKKFFDVLMSKDFMLAPEYSQAKFTVAAGAVAGQTMHTGPSYPSYANIDLKIPINELVEYVPAAANRQFKDANAVEAPGNTNYMVTPKDLNIFDTKVILYAYSPQDTMETWSDRLKGLDAGPNVADFNETFSGCPHLMFNYYGILETVDNA